MPEIIVKLGDRVVQKYFLYKNNRMSIGRAPDNDIAIENPAVSRRHASIQLVNGRYILEDNQSANGTYVNGVRISKTEILDKDVITIGKHKLHFYNQDMQPSAAAPVVDEKTFVVNNQPVAHFRVLGGKQADEVHPITKVETRIGRAADNDIRLHDWFVSKHHAVVSRKGLGYVVKDLDSWRHTMVNGEVIEEATLKAGDEVQFGPKITMRFELEEIAEAAGPEGGGRMPVELGEAPPPEPEGAQIEQVHPDPEEIEEEPAGEGAAIVETVSASRAELERMYAEEPQARDSEPLVPEPHEGEPQELAAVEATIELTPADIETGGRRGKKKKKRQERAEQAAREAAMAAAQQAASEAEAQAAAETSPPPAEPPAAEEPPPAEPQAAAPQAEAVPDREYSDAEKAEIDMWEKALANPSAIIRKQAARKLKKITGRDYDVN